MIFLFHYLPSCDIVLVKNGIYIVLSLWVHLTLLITLRVSDNDNYDDDDDDHGNKNRDDSDNVHVHRFAERNHSPSSSTCD